MGTEIIAFAATSGNNLGADAGIQITEYDHAGDVHTDLEFINGDPGTSEDGDLDIDNADAILESHGYARIDMWRESGGQWGAQVEQSTR